MGELYNPFPKLPKNIRQIGDKDDVVKLYLEDYVNTYLKRLYPTGGQDLRVGLLLGNTEQHDGTPYIFIDGALEMEDVAVNGEKVTFSEAAWKKAYQNIEETFPKRTVQGWFLCGAPGCTLSPLNYWKQHSQYFGGKNQLMYLNSGIEGDESVYITSNDGFYGVKGYSIYYERNQMMQDYMILRKDVRRVESGSNDRVIHDFKQRMEGRKREAVSRSGTIHTLGMLCSVLSVVVLAGGAVMLGNYQRMKEMETVLVSVLPSGVKGWKEYKTPEENEIIVEEITGSVYPTTSDKSSGQAEGDAAAPPEEIQPAEIQPMETSPVESQPVETSSIQPQPVETSPIEPQPMETSPANTPSIEENGGNSTAVKDYPVTNMKPGEIYIVGEGETLYGICFKLYKNLEYLDDICALNQLSNVNKIISGQKLILPKI
ncbi:MAG: LysM peptidoglycan-binding domain-containing protein [Clostridium sp.]